MSTADLEICYLSANEAIKKFKNKSISPVELLQEIIKRIESINPEINAFNQLYFEKALKEAKKSEDKYFSDALTLPLDGLPTAIKDEVSIDGQINTMGSQMFKNNLSRHTDIDVERIVNSGAIIHARSTCPEFSLTSFTHSILNGVSKNPWNLNFSPGGSSGGSGASLAAGMTTIATGSDIGGSIRIPASACGIVGYKPPYGRNPITHPFNLDHYCVVGPMARTVSDCALMQNVMCGPHPNDITTVSPKKTLSLDYENIKGWKIAYSLDLGFFEVDETVEKNTLEAVEKFKTLGASVNEIKLNWKKEEVDSTCYSHYAGGAFFRTLAEVPEDERQEMTEYAQMYAKLSDLHFKAIAEDKKIYSDELGAYLGYTSRDCANVAGEMYLEISPILEEYDILICPTNCLPSVKADMDLKKDKVIINNKVQEGPDVSWCMSYPFNILGRLPVLAVPSGFSNLGVPTGIQLVSKAFCDEKVFQGGYNFEKLDPWLNSKEKWPLIG